VAFTTSDGFVGLLNVLQVLRPQAVASGFESDFEVTFSCEVVSETIIQADKRSIAALTCVYPAERFVSDHNHLANQTDKFIAANPCCLQAWNSSALVSTRPNFGVEWSPRLAHSETATSSRFVPAIPCLRDHIRPY
jgi:hypothetical protein